MLAIDKAKTRLTNRFWPATAAVDVATMNAAIAAATGPLLAEIERLTAGRVVDQAMARIIKNQVADVENQLANLHVE